jgi:tetratricopeptide (TPR) repeat protein
MHSRCLLFVLLALVWMGADAMAQVPVLPGGLEPGAHGVGFRLITVEDGTRLTGGRAAPADRGASRARTLRLHVWYPAAPASGGGRLTIGDYLALAGPAGGTHRADLPRILGLTLTDAEWRTYTTFPLTATRDAAPAAGAFPLIVGMLRPVSSIVAAEHLASHGYVVGFVERQPQERILAEGRRREGLVMMEGVRDLEVAISRLRQEPIVDGRRLGAQGVGSDGLAQLVLAMRHPDVDAVALLESIWRAPDNTTSYQEVPAYDPLVLRAPLFYAYSLNLGRDTNEHIADLAAMRYAPTSLLYLGEPKMTHADFFTEGMVLATVLERRAPARAALARASQAIYGYQRTFFDAYVKGDAGAVARVATAPAVPRGGSMIELVHTPAIVPALSRSELQAGMTGDPATALARARADLARDPKAPVFEEAWLNQTGYGFLQRNQQAAAVAVLTLASEAYPQSANTLDSLSEVLEAAGRRSEALAAAERALALLPGDTGMPAAQRASLEAGLRARVQRLKQPAVHSS